MKREFVVLEAIDPRRGPLSWVRTTKTRQRWDTLQEALDELGRKGWSLDTTIYGPEREGRHGNHHCGAFVFQQRSGVEYAILKVDPNQGPLAGLSCKRAGKTWRGHSALEDALNELGQDGWAFCTTIYGPLGNPGDHYCEAIVLHRPLLDASDNTVQRPETQSASPSLA